MENLNDDFLWKSELRLSDDFLWKSELNDGFLWKSELNDDLLYSICEYLEPNELLVYGGVNKEFQKVCDELLNKYAQTLFNHKNATKSDYLYYLSEKHLQTLRSSIPKINEVIVKKRYLLDEKDLAGYEFVDYVRTWNIYDKKIVSYDILDVFKIHFYKYGRLIRGGDVVD